MIPRACCNVYDGMTRKSIKTKTDSQQWLAFEQSELYAYAYGCKLIYRVLVISLVSERCMFVFEPCITRTSSPVMINDRRMTVSLFSDSGQYWVYKLCGSVEGEKDGVCKEEVEYTLDTEL